MQLQCTELGDNVQSVAALKVIDLGKRQHAFGRVWNARFSCVGTAPSHIHHCRADDDGELLRRLLLQQLPMLQHLCLSVCLLQLMHTKVLLALCFISCFVGLLCSCWWLCGLQRALVQM